MLTIESFKKLLNNLGHKNLRKPVKGEPMTDFICDDCKSLCSIVSVGNIERPLLVHSERGEESKLTLTIPHGKLDEGLIANPRQYSVGATDFNSITGMTWIDSDEPNVRHFCKRYRVMA
jgi:hypothetical protein